MGKGFPRRSLFQLAGAAALLRSRVASAQQAPPPGQAPAAPGQPAGAGRGPGMWRWGATPSRSPSWNAGLPWR